MNHGNWPKVPLGELIARRKEAIDIEDDKQYKRVTIRLKGGGVSVRDEPFGAEIGTKRQFLIRVGQFLLSKIDAMNGAFGVVDNTCDGAIITGNFWAFDVSEERLDARYFYFVTHTHEFLDFCVRSSSGTTNRRYLREPLLLAQQISLPPLHEQKQIVKRIDDLVSKVDSVRGMLEQVDDEAAALLQSRFSEVIKGVTRHRMSDVAPIVRRKIVPRAGEEYPELGVRSFGKGTFHKPPLDFLSVGTKKLFSIEPGDLVFNNVFAWEGAIAVAREEDAGRCGSHRFITCVPIENVVSAEFLCYFFLTPEGLDLIGQASPGGAGRNRTLGLEKLAAIEVPVPDYKDQVRFEALMQLVREVELENSSSFSELDAMFPAVLNQALNGEI